MICLRDSTCAKYASRFSLNPKFAMISAKTSSAASVYKVFRKRNVQFAAKTVMFLSSGVRLLLRRLVSTK